MIKHISEMNSKFLTQVEKWYKYKPTENYILSYRVKAFNYKLRSA